MRVFGLIILFGCRVLAADPIPVDWVMHMEGVNCGMLTEATVLDGMTGPAYSANTEAAGDFTRFEAIASVFTNSLSITCDGTNYTAGTNCIKAITETNLADDVFIIKFASADDSTITNVHLFGLVKWSFTNNTASLMNIDPVLVYGGGGSWFVSQWQTLTNNSMFRMVAHSNAGTGEFANAEGLTEVEMLWEIVFIANARGYFRLRNASAGYALIGEGSIAITPTVEPYGHFWMLHFKAGYIGDPLGAIYYDDYSARFNNTNFLSDAELGITAQAGPTNARANVANVGTVVIQ